MCDSTASNSKPLEPCVICLIRGKAQFRSYMSTDVLLFTTDMFYVEKFGLKFPRCCLFFRLWSYFCTTSVLEADLGFHIRIILFGKGQT